MYKIPDYIPMIILALVSAGIIIFAVDGYLTFDPEHRARGEASKETWIFFGMISIVSGMASFRYYKSWKATRKQPNPTEVD